MAANASLNAPPLRSPIHKVHHVGAVFPGEVEKLSSVQVRCFFPKKGLKTPTKVRTLPWLQPIAASNVPVVQQCLKHRSFTSPSSLPRSASPIFHRASSARQTRADKRPPVWRLHPLYSITSPSAAKLPGQSGRKISLALRHTVRGICQFCKRGLVLGPQSACRRAFHRPHPPLAGKSGLPAEIRMRSICGIPILMPGRTKRPIRRATWHVG